MKKKTIIYQVLPRLFGNTHTNCIPYGTREQNGVGKLNDFTPKVLQSIKQLGCTHIWYTGIIEHATCTDYSAYGIRPDNPHVVKGNAGSPYAIKDYYDIDPDLAEDIPNRMAEFEALIDRTHKAGLSVIIDFVPNHVARQYHSDAKPIGIKDLGENDDETVHFSPQNNFYYIPRHEFAGQFNLGEGKDRYIEYPAKATGNDCFGAYPAVTDWYETVKLNYGVDYQHGKSYHFDPVPDTWNKMLEILLFWASKEIDGFRCDMAEMVPVEFWAWVIPQIKKRYPLLVFIAEVYNPNEYRNYIQRGKFDYLYDKVGLYDLLVGLTRGFGSATQITGCWQSLGDLQPHMLNFIENHDEVRIASSMLKEYPLRAIPALVVSATINVNPMMIYFGQELGETGSDSEGFSGNDGRTTIFDYWSIDSVRRWYDNGKCDYDKLTPEEKTLREQYKKILTLCNSEAAIREGAFFDLMYVNYDNPGFNACRQYAYLRSHKDELLIILVNFDAYDAHVDIRIPEHAFEYFDFTPGDYTVKELLSEIEEEKSVKPQRPFVTHIKAYGAQIWKVSSLNKKDDSRKKKKTND